MKNKTVIITGASDGIGAITAQELRKQGARVIVIGRSLDKTRTVAERIDAEYYTADFTKLDDVRDLALQLKRKYPRIDVLINNAGGIFGKREITVDGNEKTLQVNHLAHFLLTNLLMDTLLKSKATVINVSSIASWLYGKIDKYDLNLEHGFTPNRAYGNAKLANILFTKELHARYHNEGLSTVAVHPGNVATNFASNTTSLLRFLYRTSLGKLFLIRPAKGAEPLIWFASSTPNEDWQSGMYYERLRTGRERAQALNTDLARDVWNYSVVHTNRK